MRALIVVAALALPVVVGLAYSLLGALGIVGPAAGGLSLAPLGRVLSDSAVWAGLGWSLWVAGASTLLAGAGAVAVAVALRRRTPANALGRVFAVLPLPIPHIVAALLGVLVLGQSGLLARAAFGLGWIGAPADMPALVYDRWGTGVILTLVWKEIPFLALVAMSVLATRSTAAEEAARTVGASRWGAFRHAIWPQLWRGMLPAAVAVFTFVFGSYEVAALMAPSRPLALPLLTLERYTDAALGSRAEAYALVLLGFLVAVVAVAAHEWARTRWVEVTP